MCIYVLMGQGCLLTGVFASKYIVELDGTSIPGGWMDGNFIQVPIQLLAAVVALSWSFVVTFLILVVRVTKW